MKIGGKAIRLDRSPLILFELFYRKLKNILKTILSEDYS